MKWNSGLSSNLNALENGSWDDMANASNDMNKKSRYADGGRVKNCAPSSLSALDRGDWGAMANESCQMEQSFHGFADGGSVNESQINPGFNQGFNTSAYAKGGSVKKDAQKLKHMGRDGDTELIHVNKAEERMLKAMGGRGSVNPKTGLREYPLLGGIFNLLGSKAAQILGLSGASYAAKEAVEEFILNSTAEEKKKIAENIIQNVEENNDLSPDIKNKLKEFAVDLNTEENMEKFSSPIPEDKRSFLENAQIKLGRNIATYGTNPNVVNFGMHTIDELNRDFNHNNDEFYNPLNAATVSNEVKHFKDKYNEHKKRLNDFVPKKEPDSIPTTKSNIGNLNINMRPFVRTSPLIQAQENTVPTENPFKKIYKYHGFNMSKKQLEEQNKNYNNKKRIQDDLL